MPGCISMPQQGLRARCGWCLCADAMQSDKISSVANTEAPGAGAVLARGLLGRYKAVEPKH